MRKHYFRCSSIVLLLFFAFFFDVDAQSLNWSEANQFGILAGGKIMASDPIVVKGSAGASGSIDSNVDVTRDFLDNGQGDVNGALSIFQDNINYCNGLSGTAINSSLGGQVLTAGVYEISSSAVLANSSSLELRGDSNSVFVFNISGELTLESLSGIKIGGVRPGNIYWNVNGKIFIQSSARAFGVFMSRNSIYKTGINFGKVTLLALQEIEINISNFGGIGHKEFYSVEEMLKGFSSAKIINCPESTFASISQLAYPFYPNLISNSSFEDLFRCPTGFLAANTGFNSILQNSSDVCHWFAPYSSIANNTATPDYFNSCSTILNELDVPNNNFGHQTAHNGGGAYAGFYAFVEPDSLLGLPYDYREYLRQEMAPDRALVANKRYYGEYYVSLSDESGLEVKNLGMAVTGTEPTFLTDWIISDPNQPAQIQYSGPAITDTIGWTRVSGSFIARGGETFITIGNFINTSTTSAGSVLMSGAATNQSYYLVDNVGLYELPDAGENVLLAACNTITSFNLGRGRPLPPNINPTYEWTADSEPGFTANTLFITVSPVRPTVYTLTIKAHGEIISVTSVKISGTIALGAPNQITTINAGLTRFGGKIVFAGDYHVLGALELVGGDFYTESGTVFNVEPEDGVEAVKLNIFEFTPYLTQNNGQTYPTIIKVGRTGPGQITHLFLDGATLVPSTCKSREKWGGLHITDGAQIFTSSAPDPKNPAATLKTTISEAYVGVGSSQLSGTAKTVNTNRYIFENTVFQKCDYGFWDMCKQQAATANEGIIECTFDGNGTGVFLDDEPLVGGFQIGGNYALGVYKGNTFTSNIIGFKGQANSISIESSTFNNSQDNIIINSVDNLSPARVLSNSIIVNNTGKGIISNGNATISDNTLTGVPAWQSSTGIQLGYSTTASDNKLINVGTGIEVNTNVYDQLTIEKNTFTDNLTGILFSSPSYPTIPTGGNVPPRVSCNTFTAANVPVSFTTKGIHMLTGVRMVKPTANPSANRLGEPLAPSGNKFINVGNPILNDGAAALTYHIYFQSNDDLPQGTIAGIAGGAIPPPNSLADPTDACHGGNNPGVNSRTGNLKQGASITELGKDQLGQNYPNPGKIETNIPVALSADYKTATVLIRNLLNGSLVNSF